MTEMQLSLMGILITPFILFMIFVAPIWVILHYRAKSKMTEGLKEIDTDRVRQLAQQAEDMQDRIAILERLLDAENPNWRKDRRWEGS